MRLIEIVLNENPPLVEMANLYKEDTGLDYPLWIGRVEGQHGLRIKVSNIKGKWRENNNFVMDISQSPQIITPHTCKLNKAEITKISKWIILNHDDLMILWWMFERGALVVQDEDTGLILNYDDIIDRLGKV